MELSIERMCCVGCAGTVAEAIRSVDAAARVETDTKTGTVRVETGAGREAITAALAAAGYPATAN